MKRINSIVLHIKILLALAVFFSVNAFSNPNDKFLKLAKENYSRWLIPKINIGDIVFHCLFSVHASFKSQVKVPRLSCDLRFAASKEDEDPRWNSYWYGEDGL